jgi:hypothetical protein
MPASPDANLLAPSPAAFTTMRGRSRRRAGVPGAQRLAPQQGAGFALARRRQPARRLAARQFALAEFVVKFVRLHKGFDLVHAKNSLFFVAVGSSDKSDRTKTRAGRV